MTLREKLHAVYGQIDYIEKLGKNTGQNYKYLQSADVVREIRQQLFEQKVYAEINFDVVGEPYTIARHKEPDTPFSVVNVKCSVVFHDLDSNETLTSSGLGSGGDLGDKAIYKAETGALKYALKNAFLVPDAPGAVSMDPEADPTLDDRSAPDTAYDGGHPAPRPQSIPKAPEPDPVTLTKIFGAQIADTSGPSTEPISAAPVREPGDESETAPASALPNEDQKKDYNDRFRNLANNLADQGKLAASAGLRPGQKLKVFIQNMEEVNTPKDLTVAQWDNFFARVDRVTATEKGWLKLAALVNESNGIEPKGKK